MAMAASTGLCYPEPGDLREPGKREEGLRGSIGQDKLSVEQAKAFELVKKGHNVLITGSGGVGKSRLVQHITHWLGEQRTAFAATAPTGVAAIGIGGCTIHSWAGVAVPAEYNDFWKVLPSARVREAKVLLIDEVSMLSGEMFDCLELAIAIARQEEEFFAWAQAQPELRTYVSRHENPPFHQIYELRDQMPFLAPWGGLQLVLIGDFFQLPPIPVRTPKSSSAVDDELEVPGREMFLNRGWVFQARTWAQCAIRRCELTQVFRQKDEAFIRTLHAIRMGKPLAAEQQRLLRHLPTSLPKRDDGIAPTTLYCTNKKVDAMNLQQLESLQTPQRTCMAKDKWELEGETVQALRTKYGPDSPQFRKVVARMTKDLDRLRRQFHDRDCRAKREVHLKVGAQVMLLANLDLDNALFNGSRGVVQGMCSAAEHREYLVERCKTAEDYERAVLSERHVCVCVHFCVHVTGVHASVCVCVCVHVRGRVHSCV